MCIHDIVLWYACVGNMSTTDISAYSTDIFNGTLVTQADEASSCDLDIETDGSRLYGPTQYPHHHPVLTVMLP